MDEISSEALSSLNTVVNALFAGIAPAPVVDILPVKISPTGLGGFVALHEDPVGDRIGRQIDAQVRVLVSGNSPAAVITAANAVNQAVLSLSRLEMAQRGILRAGVDTSVPLPTEENTRLLGFRLIYEFIKDPEEAGDIIIEIPINLSQG